MKECLSRGFYLDEIGESLRSAGVAGKRVAESHPPLEDFLGKDGTYGRNFRDILKNVFHRYGEGYSADAFVAFSKEMAKRDPELAKRLRRFLGQFASGKFDGDDGYDRWGDDQGKCSSIASALQGMLAAAL